MSPDSAGIGTSPRRAPRVSVVMPTYNGREHINCAVRSVLEQQGADWEMIVSDDGSTDGTREYLEAIADPRVRLFFQSERLGIFGNLNFCIARASAPIPRKACEALATFRI